ncbi:MAG TPA: hypothetical protein VF941_15705 [Clostridia bacterium]
MLLDITLKQGKDMHCVESELATISSYYKRNHEMAFLDAWKFGLLRENESHEGTLGGRIYTGYVQDWWMWGNLEEYHGIKVLWHEDYENKDIIYIIKSELELMRPVSVMFDSFYLPWAPEHEKYTNYATLMIIVGIDEKGVYCIDTHNLKRVEFLQLENFLKGRKQYTVFLPMRAEEKEINWREAFGKRAKRLLGENGGSFDEMRELARCVDDSLDFAVEIQGKPHPLKVDIIKNIETVGRGRFLFSNTLKYINELYNLNAFAALEESFKNISNVWHLIKYQLIRHYYIGRLDKADCRMIAGKIKEAANMEENMAHRILEITQSDIKENSSKFSDKSSAPSMDEMNELVFVDLLGSKKCYMENPELTEKSLLRGMQFTIPDSPEDVSCTGQIIPVPSGYYKSIFLVGCSIWGSYSEKLTVTYMDGNNEEIKIGFTDHDSGIPLFGESVFYKGNLIKADNDENSGMNGHLYSSTHCLNGEKQMKQIQLPDYPNILIYGIALGR